MENLLPHGGSLQYFPDLFTEAESRFYFDDLFRHVEWLQQPVRIFGKLVMQPRLTAWYADEQVTYSYSGITLTGLKWNASLLSVKARVEAAAGKKFNSALQNLYRDGNDSMGWHRDNEKELGTDPVIASVSFGATRKFYMREYSGKGNLVTLEPANGSLILMAGASQTNWEHAVPKTKKLPGPRLNITFRHIL